LILICTGSQLLKKFPSFFISFQFILFGGHFGGHLVVTLYGGLNSQKFPCRIGSF